mmetsp:Transcript_74874/g.173562  ORF Transcript_74874/g.173562 Transcript_74874/m.173562 type:complete len:227 (-) Transcript_74874:296-976(-)
MVTRRLLLACALLRAQLGQSRLGQPAAVPQPVYYPYGQPAYSPPAYDSSAYGLPALSQPGLDPFGYTQAIQSQSAYAQPRPATLAPAQYPYAPPLNTSPFQTQKNGNFSGFMARTVSTVQDRMAKVQSGLKTVADTISGVSRVMKLAGPAVAANHGLRPMEHDTVKELQNKQNLADVGKIVGTVAGKLGAFGAVNTLLDAALPANDPAERTLMKALAGAGLLAGQR